MIDKPTTPFWPVGEIESLGQVIGELRIAADRLEIQAGVMKDWSERFRALAGALTARSTTPTDGSTAKQRVTGYGFDSATGREFPCDKNGKEVFITTPADRSKPHRI